MAHSHPVLSLSLSLTHTHTHTLSLSLSLLTTFAFFLRPLSFIFQITHTLPPPSSPSPLSRCQATFRRPLGPTDSRRDSQRPAPQGRNRTGADCLIFLGKKGHGNLECVCVCSYACATYFLIHSHKSQLCCCFTNLCIYSLPLYLSLFHALYVRPSC